MTQDIFDINKINKNDIYVKENFCFILIDTETCNGFDKKNNAIIQLAFMFLGTDYIFNSYCKPDNTIPWRNNYEKFIPKIKKEDLNNAPCLIEVLISFKKIIYCIEDIKPVLIAHNSSFDKNMINLCFNYYNMEFGNIKWCNTMNSLFFNIKDEKDKYIKSLEAISKCLFQNDILDFHDAKNDVYNLYKCLLKIHKNNEEIVCLVLKSIKNNKYEKDKFLLEYKSILDNFNEFCNFDKITITTDNSKYIELYQKILEKEKEISKYKNIIKDRIIDLLKNNGNHLYVNNKEISLNEYTMKNLNSKEIKDNYPDIYNKCIKEIKYNKIIIKEK